MTGAAEPPLAKTVTWLAHALPWLLVVSLAARVAYLLQLLPIAPAAAADIIGSFTLLAGFIALTKHLSTGRLCLRCIRSAPLNPEWDVKRNKTFLWEIHIDRAKFFGVYAATWVLGGLISPIWLHGFIATLCRLPLDVMFFSLIWSLYIHHRLGPWCPYCRGWDEGGDPELVPDPDPAEKGTR